MRSKRQATSRWMVRPQLLIGLAAVVTAMVGMQTMLTSAQPISDLPSSHVLSVVVRSVNPVAAPPRPLPPPDREIPDCGLQPCLALTFDDGPNPLYTPKVLDILERHKARATFFVVGSRVPGNEALLRRMYTDGDEIGNHSWSHTDFTTLSAAQIEQQINQTQAVVAAAGVPVPTLFRPPYGAINSVVRSHVPLTMALWNVDPEDWRARNPNEIIAHVNATAKPGAIVDMHDIQSHTAEALDPLLNDLSQHYQFVTVTELLNLPAGQRGAYYGR